MAATKKSGTIAYQLRRQNDLTGTATEKNPQMAVTVVNSKLTTTKELAEYINFACSVTESDIAAVLQALGKCVCDELLDGNRVELGEIGTLSVTLTCGNKHRADKVTARDVKVRRIAFAPSKELTHAMQGAAMKSAGPMRTKQLTIEEAEERLAAHFTTNTELYRSEVESICECTRYRAMQLIEAFIKAGKLQAAGRKNGRHYVAMAGSFGK